MSNLPVILHNQSCATQKANEAQAVFQTLMQALSNPGNIFTLPGETFSTPQSCLQIGLTLLDLETTFYTPDLNFRRDLKEFGAQFRTVSSADYLFFPAYDAFDVPMLQVTLDCLEQAKIGTLSDPDQSATLIIGCLFGEGRKLQLRGPGIQTAIHLIVDELPLQFWQLRNRKINYPLGIDLFLVDGDQIVGLPRTTILEIE